VGCRVGAVEESIGLSAPVAAAVPEAIAAVRELVERIVAQPAESGRS
jgi:hydrogenase maturation protease